MVSVAALGVAGLSAAGAAGVAFAYGLTLPGVAFALMSIGCVYLAGESCRRG